MRNQLFGGALLAAGLGAAAHAQEFDIGSGGYSNFYGAQQYAYLSFTINGFYEESDSVGTSYAHALGSASTILAYSSAGDTGLAYVIHLPDVPFGVTSDTDAVVSWDFSGDVAGGPFVDSFIDVSGTDGTSVFADLNNPVGSVNISLSAAEDYTFRGTALAVDGVSQWSITIVPAPPGVALLGMGGLIAARRRR